MKFKQEEHDAFKEEILKSGKDYTAFSFTKKKGWLSINTNTSKISFMYHRKSETRLSDDGKWHKDEKFFVQLSGKKVEFAEFKGVMDSFTNWVQNLM